MSTPASGVSIRCSSSTVFGVGSWMSISRLWVRISKCSRESLSLNGSGSRSTRSSRSAAGSGRTPGHRCAAPSPRSRGRRSIASWSYALRRIRILLLDCCHFAVLGCSVCVIRCALFAQLGRRRVERRPGSYVLDVLRRRRRRETGRPRGRPWCYSMIFVTIPEPTVPTALSDRETQTLVHRDRLDQLDRHRHVVPGHHHLRALGKLSDPGHVRGPEVELGPVSGEEQGMASALLLLEGSTPRPRTSCAA